MMNDFAKRIVRAHCRPRIGEARVHAFAVITMKRGGDFAFERSATAFAERRHDWLDLCRARGANETLLGRSSCFFAYLANLGVEKTQACAPPISSASEQG